MKTLGPDFGRALSIVCFLGFILPHLTLAFQANLAGIVDWHKPLIGPPLLEPTPPSYIGDRIIAITRKNVLAVLEADSGEIVWRHLLDESDPVVSYHVQDEYVLLLSGPSAVTARLFSLSTGHVLWERTLIADIKLAHLTNPVYLGTDAAFTVEAERAVVILSDGQRVSKLSVANGTVLWSLEAPGVGSTILFKQILISGNTVHILALTSAFATSTLTTMSLDLQTSAPLSDLTQIPSIVALPSDAVLAAASTPGPARILWFEHGRIRSAYLSEGGQLGDTKDLLPGKGRLYARILDVGVRSQGLLLGQGEDDVVDIVDVRGGAKIVDTFDSSKYSSDRSSSVYSAVETEHGVMFNRLYWSFSLNLAVAQTYSIPTTGGSTSSGFTFPFDTASHGVIVGASASSTLSSAQLPSLMLASSSGALQLFKQEVCRWTREESLAEIDAVRFIDLGEPEVEEVRHLMTEEGFVGRLIRQIYELRALPAHISRFIRRFTSSSYSSAVSTVPLTLSRLHRDQFGLQKLLVAVTKGGKLFAMDSANGNIIWSRNLGLVVQSNPELAIHGMWLVRQLGESGSPMLAVLATRTKNEVIVTVGYHINALTGEVSGERDAVTGLRSGTEVSLGTPATAFLLPFDNCDMKIRVLAVVDPSSVLHVFPTCKKVAADLENMSSKMFFTTDDRTLSDTTIRGFAPSSAAINTSFKTSEIWTRSFPSSETVLSVELVGYDAVASFGRVLGDKSTLYKYLNPHLSLVTTTSPAAGTAHIYVIDTITGGTVYAVDLLDVAAEEKVQSAMVENWLVYAWRDTNGRRIASVELYEDRTGGKIETPGLSTFSNQHRIRAISKTFVISTEVKTMGMTKSKVGITAKELIFVNGQNQIITIPRRLLDPRRPVGKPTSSDKEEMLIPYDPFIPPDQKRVISHQYQILGTKSFVSSPALLESTSLLFAYGLDLFLTRGLTPSGTFDILSDSFNKVQLLLTLAGLSIGIMVARPAVQRKALRAKWF